jgi:hypothetical protein
MPLFSIFYILVDKVTCQGAGMMECYNHTGKMSVTLCKICHKGLCHDCSQFVGKSFVCSDTCGEQLGLQEQIQEWSSRYVVNRGKYSLMSRQYRNIALTFIIFGFTILAPVVYDYFVYGDRINFPISALGIAMFLAAILCYRSIPK